VREADADRARFHPDAAGLDAERDAALRERQPWKAAVEKDYAWLGDVVTNHYHGDDSGVRVLMGGILKAFEGISVDDYGTEAGAQHRILLADERFGILYSEY